jgi:two-component system osmolarity sensor histidine kinase EnvZ
MFSLRQILPKSIFWRAFLIIILPIIIMQMAVAYFFFNAHWARVTANLSDSVAADVAVAVQLYSADPTVENTEALDALLRPDMELSVVLRPGDDLPTARRNAFFSNLDKTLRRSLTETLDAPFWFDTTRYPNHIDIRVGVDEGVLRFIAARERVFAPTGYVFIFWLITSTVVLSLISILFIRRQSDPIRELADAAAAFGKGQDISGFKPRGASEVRMAGQSFLKMRRRIRRHLEQRTLMLAGVSHDLRTPLTRLKLQLAMQDDTPDTRAARRDVDEMEAMLTGYLDFARGMGKEKPEAMRLSEFLEQTLKQRDDVETVPYVDRDIEIRPLMLKRALGNLINNARKYGQRTRLSLEETPDFLLFHVDDDGPGIPAGQRAQVFKAFQRLDEARNQNVEGVGLGLSIAQDIAQLHGGTILLSDSELGGLRATLRLPL